MAFESPTRGPSIARNAFHLVLGQVTTTALAIFFSAALGRSLGARDFGLYFLISSFSTFAYVVVDWGMQYYVIREVARTPERAGEVLGTVLVLRTVCSLLILLPAALMVLALGYDARTSWFSVAYLVVSLPFFLAQGFGLVFRGRDRMGLDSAISVVNKAAVLALALGALALGTGLTGVVASQMIAGIIAIAVSSWFYGRCALSPITFSAQTIRAMVAGSKALGFMMVAASVQPYLDAIVLSKLAPADAIGWYGAAKNIMGTLTAPAIIVAAAAFPQLARTSSEPAAFNVEVRTVLRPILWLGALAAVGSYLFSDDAIAVVYGQRHFAPAGVILRVFAPGFFLLFIDNLLGNALTAMGRMAALSLVKSASVVLSTGLELLLIPYFQRRVGNGGIGVVTAFMASEVVMFGGAALLMPRGAVGRPVIVDIARAIASAVITVLFFHLIPPVNLFIGLPLCVTVFVACTVALRLLRRADLEQLKALFRRGQPAEPETSRTASAWRAGRA